MAKRTEVIELNEAEVKEAISDWLHNKYGPPKPDMQHRPNLQPWKVTLRAVPHYDEAPTYEAEASRVTD